MVAQWDGIFELCIKNMGDADELGSALMKWVLSRPVEEWFSSFSSIFAWYLIIFQSRVDWQIIKHPNIWQEMKKNLDQLNW